MMFREKSISKFYAFTLAAVFALTLAGCGGGGGGMATTDPGTTDPPATCDPGYTGTPPNCEPERTPQQTCEGAGGRYETDGSCTSAEDRITEAARNSCVAAGGRFEADGMCTSASAVAQETCEGDGGRYEMNGSCTSSEDVATETCIAGGGRSNADGSCTSADDLATTKSAGTKAKAISDEAGQETDAGIGGRDENGAAITPYTLTVSRDADGITAKVVDVPNNGDDDKKFAEAVNFANGSMQVRTMDADDDGNVAEEVVVVRTDITAPKATKFTTVYPINATTGVNTNMDNDDPDVTYEALTIVGGDGANANAGMLTSDAFVKGPGTQTLLTFAREVEADANNNVAAVEAYETMASFDGGSGTLKCAATTGDGCTVTLDEKGEVTTASEGWIFTPAGDAKVDVADTNYLRYGFWLKRTTDADGATTYNAVETFADAMGHPETGNSDLAQVTGTAKYEGGAAGVYVKNVTDNEGAVFTATAGQFEAKVELNASFGGGGVASNDQFTISGEVTDFTLHETDGPSYKNDDWGVKLGLTDFSGRADGDAPGESGPSNSHDNEFSGTATGDSTAAAGSWNGVFWGNSASGDHDMDNETPDTSPQPVAVTGEFNANFTDGTAAGAFGANKK